LEVAVADIAGLRGTAPVRWASGEQAARLRAGVAAVPAVPELAAALDALAGADPVLQTGCWHGDLNPGNLSDAGTRLQVWDWERFETGVPVGLDLLHHDLQRDVTVRGHAPATAARRLVESAPQTLAVLGVPAAAARATVLVYLLTIGTRFAADRQEEAGAPLGRIDEWLVPALHLARERATTPGED
jgi:hypothetical protein